jgi:hypothetical protein
MQILELSNIDINVDLTLLSSDIEFLDDKTVLIFLYFEVGLLKLCSTNLISISQERLDLYIDKKITVLKIKDNCAVAVGELQRIFSRAVSYEYRSNRKY